MTKVGVLDYGAGNLASVEKAFRAVGCETVRCASSAELHDVGAMVVPGVGHFEATGAIAGELRTTIRRRVEAGVPLLGICLGMQWLFDGSAEASTVPGLGLIAGQCFRLDVDRPLKVPHVGWNSLRVTRAGRLMDGVLDGSQVYFTHSFAAPAGADCAATTTHGVEFAAAVERQHVCGVQFHPEKSGEIGLRVLRNFLRIART
jgi:glutamine amidotransferase